MRSLFVTGAVIALVSADFQITHNGLCLTLQSEKLYITSDANGKSSFSPYATFAECSKFKDPAQWFDFTENKQLRAGGKCLTAKPLGKWAHENLDGCDAWKNAQSPSSNDGVGTWLFADDCADSKHVKKAQQFEFQEVRAGSCEMKFVSACGHGFGLASSSSGMVALASDKNKWPKGVLTMVEESTEVGAPHCTKMTTTRPVTEKPTTAKPTTRKPVTEKPTTRAPITTKPVKSTTRAPVTTKPAKPIDTTTKKTDIHNSTCHHENIIRDDHSIRSLNEPDFCITHDDHDIKEKLFWRKCNSKDVHFQFYYEKDADGFGYIKAKGHEHDGGRCFSILNKRRAKNQNVMLKRCKGQQRQQWILKEGAIWLNFTGDQGQKYCIPFLGKGEKLKTKRCFEGIQLGGRA